MYLQKELYTKILEIAQQQSKCLDREDIEGFDKLVPEQKQLIDRVVNMGKRLDKKNEECKKIRDEIVRLNQQNIDRYEIMLDQVQNNLRNLRKHKQFGMAYKTQYNASFEEGIFFDKRSK
ncbi:MAG: hypothetical protein ATN34_04190 [Epulopiscium sp. Nele67-Bin002]|nr:MAG: hypothetical protein BEN18_03485 [Epulopiscium sp. Nuni2H_MBin001]OON92399.1 MAG: hypothetical protein ATN33_07405 [Epulopiscium sp. Nele67-Bin001]OON92541.1 MAG: hypothetical protein ATN34_04190 [Epulopiscium sp. Nele67-Bin002]